MLRPDRPYGEDEGDYNDIALPTPKRRKTCAVERTSLDNPNGADQSISNGINAGCSPAQATEAGDVVESSGKSQKICFGMVSFYH